MLTINREFKLSTFIGNVLLCLIGLFYSSSAVHAASDLTIASDGTVSSLVLWDTNRLANAGAGGFEIDSGDGNGYQDPQSVSYNGDDVTVTASGGSPSYTVRILEREKYVAITLLDAQGVSEDDGSILRLSIKRSGDIGVKKFDDLVSIGGNSAYTRIEWEYAWHQRFNGSGGGFALYDGSLSDSDHDLALADIWSTESESDMPRPAGQTSWTPTDVLAWVDQFATKFSNQTKAAVQASTEAELYAMTDDYVIPNGFKRVYLHCNTWRGQYFLTDQVIDDVNLDVFPNGQSDLKAYADYLEANGIQLQLHNLSLGIGLEDPGYIVGTVDRRLASWGSGTLESEITESSTTIQFTPESGVAYPPTEAWELEWSLYIRIDEEIIGLTDIDTSGSIWQATVSSRGYGGTDAASHESSAEVVGIWCPYGKMFVPADDLDQPDSLTDEMAQKYAALINYAGLDHLHFDGMRMHDFKPWVSRDLTGRVYSYVDHPTTSSQVGDVIPANFEYEFSQNRENKTILYREIGVSLRDELDATDDFQDLAINWMGVHFQPQDDIMADTRGVVMSRPASSKGLTVDLMKNHGWAGKTLLLFHHWKTIAPVLHDDDVAYISGVMVEADGAHYESEDVLVLERDDSNQFVFTPHRVLGGVDDEMFKINQEYGTVWRRQVINVGDTLSALNNPHAEQELTFFIRNRYDGDAIWTNPQIEIEGSGSLAVIGDIDPGESLEFTGGETANLLDSNMRLIQTLPLLKSSFTVPTGDVSISVLGSGSAALDIQFITKGTPYVLKANDSLPTTYSALVENGVGSGNYAAGTVVNLHANPPSGAVFDQWVGDIATVANVYSPDTTLTMPDDGIEVVAEYVMAENVALGKSTEQSSEESANDSALAVDGNTSGDFADGSVTHTENEANPWWEVDLGDNYYISEIWVYNRTDGNSKSRLSDFTVSVEDSSGATLWSQTVSDYPDPSVALNTGGVSGSKVRVQLNGSNVLHLAEVVVLSYTNKGSSNLALGQSVTQSSTDHEGVAERAVDGNTDGDWADGSVTHTESEANAWWEVDLGADIDIGDIVLFNRTNNSTKSRLSDFTVSVIDSNDVTTFSQSIANYPDPTTTINADNAVGSKIRIQLNDTGILSLAEVKVYEGTAPDMPTASWLFEEGEGSIASDATGNGHHATVENATWAYGALDFNGSSARVQLPASAFESISDEITISMWVYGAESQPRNDTVLYAEDALGNQVLKIHLPWGNSKIYWDAGSSEGYDRMIELADESDFKGWWNHWVFTKNVATPGSMKIYLNGELWRSEFLTTQAVGEIATVTLGSTLLDNYYDGMLDEVKIYDVELSLAEVEELYQNTYQSKAAEDWDGDGASNLSEYVAGTDLMDPSSIFKVIDMVRTEVSESESSIDVSWASVSGKSYTLQHSTDLIEWTDVTSGIDADPPANSVTHEPEGPAAFYRVIIE
ncbi:galactose-binding domain-containing protein [Rubritalea sp.]|uniref:galactose-binding domain-containing protein n=1 Tax=Rubritalea sp. TaxID=2109375 RepID=UPI003EF4CE72